MSSGRLYIMQHCSVANNYNYQKLCYELPKDGERSRDCSEGISRQDLTSRLRGHLPEADVEAAKEEAPEVESLCLGHNGGRGMGAHVRFFYCRPTEYLSEGSLDTLLEMLSSKPSDQVLMGRRNWNAPTTPILQCVRSNVLRRNTFQCLFCCVGMIFSCIFALREKCCIKSPPVNQKY